MPEDKNPDYLKELQAEKDSLETSVTAVEDEEASTASGIISSETEAGPTATTIETTLKTNHAIKLLEQGNLLTLNTTSRPLLTTELPFRALARYSCVFTVL